MTQKVFALDTKPGIQRDGTIFDKEFYQDGVWVRFQRGRPRKILGYRVIIPYLAGPSRGLYVNPLNAFTLVFNGYDGGVQRVSIDSDGNGTDSVYYDISNFTPNINYLWQFDGFYDVAGAGKNLLLAHAGINLQQIANTINSPVYAGEMQGATMSKIGVFTDTATTVATSTTITLGAANLLIGAGQTVTGAGIPADTTVVSVSGTSVVLSNPASASATVTVTFDNNIEVSGGVVALHPYVFVYGNDGFIKNSGAGNPNDWVSADANEVNVATGKIVQALPVRGGSNSPSGLFWALDSLIRVSYAPTTVTAGTTVTTQYWRYDIISSSTTILSSQCVIEYDGVYYWIGVDRFLLYNGVVQEVPNSMNQNYFFDNLNYKQRQKVFATKVPRFGEIWWFYPRGESEECNDAIIFNVREKTWYDAGSARGASRCAGYYSQVFHYPINADWEINATGGINNITFTGGSGYTDGTYYFTELTGGNGASAVATITIAGGTVTKVDFSARGHDYRIGDVLTASLPAGEGFSVTVTYLFNYTYLWQHEFGVDEVFGSYANAIPSMFETNDLGWVSGGPSQPSPVGDNKWLRLERVEPDFLLDGEMYLYITGRPYAQSEDQQSQPYVFDSTTNKIDMKEQRRELRLKFVSNTTGGNYQLGKVLLSGDTGDVRGY